MLLIASTSLTFFWYYLKRFRVVSAAIWPLKFQLIRLCYSDGPSLSLILSPRIGYICFKYWKKSKWLGGQHPLAHEDFYHWLCFIGQDWWFWLVYCVETRSSSVFYHSLRITWQSVVIWHSVSLSDTDSTVFSVNNMKIIIGILK